jgi:hypothetical protein
MYLKYIPLLYAMEDEELILKDTAESFPFLSK